MIDMKYRFVSGTFGLVLAAIAAASTTTPAQSTNPLLSAPMPKCGPSDASFQRLLDVLKQRRSWRGTRENATGELELTVGQNGTWLLLFHSRDSRQRKLVCLIARGTNSREYFGSPV